MKTTTNWRSVRGRVLGLLAVLASTASGQDLINLAPFQPPGWSAKIVVSTETGSHADSFTITTSDTLYIDWSVISNGPAPTTSPFRTDLFVDEKLTATWYTEPPLNSDYYTSVEDYSLGKLSPGFHNLRIRAESTGALRESDESDNEFSRAFYVSATASNAAKVTENVASRNGTKALVLLVDFPDKSGQVSREYFQDLLFGNLPAVAPRGSFKDYYLEISYGKWSISGSVNAPGVGWLRLPQSSGYYSGGCYGIGRASECTPPRYPQNPQKMIEDAIVSAKAAGIDFGQFDGNNDGTVDSLFVVHAGRGSEQSLNRNDIWSHRSMLPSRVNTGAVNALGNAVYVQAYSTEPEYWTRPGDMTIGVFAHEYGHDLGLPDLYDLGYDSAGVGLWSVMATGCWNGIMGDSPAHLDPWGKQTLGWVTPRKVFGTLANESIEQAATSSDVYQLIEGGAVSQRGEYFLVENRQRAKFDRALPGSGLLVWHVDEGAYDNRSQWYPGCTNCSGHYRVAVVQADRRWDLERNENRGDSGDPFPGVCGSGQCATEITGTSNPSTDLYSGNRIGLGITAISTPSPVMSATLAGAMSTDLSISKTHSGNFAVGSDGVYNIRVTNVGGLTTASTITVRDDLPDGLAFVSAVGTDWSCVAAGQSVACQRNSALPAGSSSTITLTVRLTASAFPRVTNAASVTVADDTDTSNNLSSDTATVTIPATNTAIPFGINSPGGVSFTSDSSSLSPVVGYGRIQPAPGNIAPFGVAIFGARENNVLISEAGVPASALVADGRISVNERGATSTGVAFANPNDVPSTISFFFTDRDGRDFGHGTVQLEPNEQLARFFTEAPFHAKRPFEGTYTFRSSHPVGVVALRGFVNERAQFLMTALPVVPLALTSRSIVTIPHFADGGGWITRVVLVNPTDDVMSGIVQFLGQSGSNVFNTFEYSIAPRGQHVLETPGQADSVGVGSVRVIPAADSMAPAGHAILSLRNNGTTVAEAGIAAGPVGSGFRLYAESRGNFVSGEPGSLQTGVALANPSNSPVTVNFEITRLDGTLVSSAISRVLPAQGQVAMFLREIPGFANLPASIEGVLRIWTDSGAAISVIGLRGHYNERRDFLVTTTPAANENDPLTSTDRIFPHIVNGGGFTTEIILFSPSAQPASGTLRFHSQRGDALNLDLR